MVCLGTRHFSAAGVTEKKPNQISEEKTKVLQTKSLFLHAALVAAVTLAATTAARAQHPHPQPRPAMTMQTSSVGPDGVVTYFVIPGTSPLPVGQNELDYVQSNIFDGNGVEMVNTLPSTPTSPFNLHDGPVQTFQIDKTSPKDDLRQVLQAIQDSAQKGFVDVQKIQFGLDILEGNPIPNKIYSGFPLLHYKGPEKVKAIVPVLDAAGNIIGGNVNVHQIWYDNHIESDTAFIDPTPIRAANVPWTVTYTIDVLNGGADDFSPFVMYFDDPALSMPGMPPMPHVAMDSTFYPMGDGTRFVIKVKHAQAKYYNLTYTWGWRIHPPRVQVMENALKKVAGLTLPQWESAVFGSAPSSSDQAKQAAIAMIGELSPAKRMWQALKNAQAAAPDQVVALMQDALISFNDWSDRTHLPRGVQADSNADVTLFYVNNTMYGNVKTFDNWKGRGSTFKATIYNGDHFDHAYINVDFGGSRGWENQFQFAGGPGGSHTFGRVHWWMNTALPLNSITVPQIAADGTLGKAMVQITLNYDPPQRLKLYQFDPLHHDVAVYSLH